MVRPAVTALALYNWTGEERYRKAADIIRVQLTAREGCVAGRYPAIARQTVTTNIDLPIGHRHQDDTDAQVYGTQL